MSVNEKGIKSGVGKDVGTKFKSATVTLKPDQSKYPHTHCKFNRVYS